MNEFEITYNRNVIGNFFRTLTLINADTKFYIDLSQIATHRPVRELADCLGRSFSFAHTNTKGKQMEESNSGFLICNQTEIIKPLIPRTCAVFEEFNYQRFPALLGKSIAEAYNTGMIDRIEVVDGDIVFQNGNPFHSFMIIDDSKVYVSSGVRSLTRDQLIKKFDELTFYSGAHSDGTPWYNLGLPFSLQWVSREPLFKE